MSCDPNTLLEQAKCLNACIPSGMLPAVNTSLLCQIVDAGSGVQNVAQQVIGAGTNYTLTTAFADVVFGTTSPTVTLPTAGTYLIMASITYQADAVGAADAIQIRLRNTTDSLSIGSSPALNAGLASNFQEAAVIGIATITASKIVTLQAANGIAARGLILATNTILLWVRLF